MIESRAKPKPLIQAKTFRVLAWDDKDPFLFFKMLKQTEKEAFFLQTSPGIGADIETTIIGLGPFKKLQNSFSKASRGRTFFSQLAEEIQDLQCKAKNGDFAYANGGVFGCIGYDCISEIEPILKKSGYFAKSKQHEPNAELLIAKRLIVFDHKAKKIYFCDASKRTSARSVKTLEARYLCWSPRRGPAIFDASFDSTRLHALCGQSLFNKSIRKIKEHIRKGDIFQAVMSERYECKTPASALEVFECLRQLSPSPYSFFFELKNRSFFGASPETLVRVKKGIATTNPIAGTRPRHKNTERDKKFEKQLLKSPKEAAEHLMLVDLARNDLGRIAVAGSVRMIFFRKIHRLSHVMHLVSEVEAKLTKKMTALDVLISCFPAGTLSGAPKIRAMEILATLESTPRGLYGGAVVAFDGLNGLDSCIAIRSLEMKSGIAILRAGAGIVADSKAEKEYAEIEQKLKLLRQAIASAEVRKEGSRRRASSY